MSGLVTDSSAGNNSSSRGSSQHQSATAAPGSLTRIAQARSKPRMSVEHVVDRVAVRSVVSRARPKRPRNKSRSASLGPSLRGSTFFKCDPEIASPNQRECIQELVCDTSDPWSRSCAVHKTRLRSKSTSSIVQAGEGPRSRATIVESVSARKKTRDWVCRERDPSAGICRAESETKSSVQKATSRWVTSRDDEPRTTKFVKDARGTQTA